MVFFFFFFLWSRDRYGVIEFDALVCYFNRFQIITKSIIFFVGKQLLQQSSNVLDNLTTNLLSKKDSVIPSLPDVDILCIQQVWERHWAATMIDHLGLKYSYFIHGKPILWRSKGGDGDEVTSIFFLFMQMSEKTAWDPIFVCLVCSIFVLILGNAQLTHVLLTIYLC